MFEFGKTSFNKFNEYLNQIEYKGDSIKVLLKTMVYIDNRKIKPKRTKQLLEFMSDIKNFKLLIKKYKLINNVKEKKILLITLNYWNEVLILNKQDIEELILLINELITSKDLFNLELGLKLIGFDKLGNSFFFDKRIWNVIMNNLQEKNIEIAIETANFLIKTVQEKNKNLIIQFKDNIILFGEFVDDMHDIILKNDSVYLIKIYNVLIDLLVDRKFYDLMMWYIVQPKYFSFHIEVLKKLKIFNMLNYFDLIKLFIANPLKPNEIKEIIIKNNELIINFLQVLSIEINKITDDDLKKIYDVDFVTVHDIVTNLRTDIKIKN